MRDLAIQLVRAVQAVTKTRVEFNDRVSLLARATPINHYDAVALYKEIGDIPPPPEFKVFQVLNGKIGPDDYEAIEGGQPMKDGWYVGNDADEDSDGPYSDEQTAQYAQFCLEMLYSLLGRGETGGRLKALIDLRTVLTSGVEDSMI